LESDGQIVLYDGETPVLTSDKPLGLGEPTRLRLSCDGAMLRLSFDGQPAGESPCPGGVHAAVHTFGGHQFRGELEAARVLDGHGRVLADWPLVGTDRDKLLRDASGNGNDLELSRATPRWQTQGLRVGRGRMYVDGVVC
jgi:hypothetical protein